MNVFFIELQNNNFTYDINQGGLSEDNGFSTDQRGFKTFIQKEAEEVPKPEQMLLNATIKNVCYPGMGVTIISVDGPKLSADYTLNTFSLGVLQHDDITFEPEPPLWKQEEIQSMVRIFLFPKLSSHLHFIHR
jgi:polyamine oxidase